MCWVRFDYVALTEDEHTLLTHETVTILEEHNSGWWYGYKSRGDYLRWIPSIYLTSIRPFAVLTPLVSASNTPGNPQAGSSSVNKVASGATSSSTVAAGMTILRFDGPYTVKFDSQISVRSWTFDRTCGAEIVLKTNPIRTVTAIKPTINDKTSLVTVKNPVGPSSSGPDILMGQTSPSMLSISSKPMFRFDKTSIAATLSNPPITWRPSNSVAAVPSDDTCIKTNTKGNANSSFNVVAATDVKVPGHDTTPWRSPVFQAASESSTTTPTFASTMTTPEPVHREAAAGKKRPAGEDQQTLPPAKRTPLVRPSTQDPENTTGSTTSFGVPSTMNSPNSTLTQLEQLSAQLSTIKVKIEAMHSKQK